MLGRDLVFALVLGLPAAALGCLLDSGAFSGEGGAGASVNNGASSPGGGGAAGSTTSTSTTTDTGGSGGTTTTSTTTTTTEPMCSSGCDDGKKCTNDDCIGGTCSNTPKPVNTPVSNSLPNDCQQEVCDGAGNVISVPDDGESPNMFGDDCFDWVCQGGSPAMSPINENQLCAGSFTPPCEISTRCQGGNCVAQNASNGDYPYPNGGECAVVTCTNGSVSAVHGNVFYCSLLPENGGCRVPECGDVGSGMLGCYLVDAPPGTSCVKANNMPGGCDDGGNCN